MLLDKLESGFLLLQTPQGLMAVEPSSFWQRAYLLWTFRNFRQLSLPLLNSRQTALINSLFRDHPEAVSHRYDPWLVIGVVENFVPPIVIDATLAAQIDASLAMKAKLPGEVAGLEVAPPVAQIEAAPVAKVDASPVAKEEPAEENAAIESIESAPKDAPGRSFVPIASWVRSIASGVVTFSRAASDVVASNLEASKVGAQTAASKIRLSRAGVTRLVASKVGTPKLTMPRLATAIGALGLCVCFVIAWHRIGAVPGSQAHNSPVQLSSPSSSPLPEPVRVAESSTTLPAVTDQRIAGAEAVVEPASVKLASSVAAIAPTPKPRIRVHDAVSSPKLPLSIQDSAIQATRPPLRFVYPAYSGANARGVVTLTAGVDSKGNVRTVKIVSGNRALAAAAVRAVRQWRYRPYIKDGQPVATESNIVISFFSSEAISMTFPPRIPVSR